MPAKILVVEDNLPNMKLVEMILVSHGYTMLKAMDGEEALEVAVRDKPDLILMDIQLPKINGMEVVKRLREMPAFQQTPIIAITAYAMKGDKEKFIESGCDAYVSKPINTRELPGLIAELLKSRMKVG